MSEPIEVKKIPLESVNDASGLALLIDDKVLQADRFLAVVGKTEGNGGVNDYTRIIAHRAFREVLVAKGTRSMAEVSKIPVLWFGGTAGVLSPHAMIFATLDSAGVEPSDEYRLAVGSAMSEAILPEEIGRPEMVVKLAAGVKEAMARAGIASPSHVHYVQTKTPLLTLPTIQEAKARGRTVWTEDTLRSMDLSNGTAVLGIGVALGEIQMPTAEQILTELSLYSSVASCSSGVELDQRQAVVVGNVRGVGGHYRVGHPLMQDALGADGIWEAIRSAGLDLPASPRCNDLKARQNRRGASVAGAASCSTTPTSTGTVRSRPASVASRPPAPATRRSSCRCRPRTRVRPEEAR